MKRSVKIIENGPPHKHITLLRDLIVFVKTMTVQDLQVSSSYTDYVMLKPSSSVVVQAATQRSKGNYRGCLMSLGAA